MDLDPQASLSQAFHGPDLAWAFPPEETLASLFDDRGPQDLEAIIHKTPFEGIYLAPAGSSLGDYNFPRPSETGPFQDSVRAFVDEIRHLFDLILLDCPPCLQLCSWASILAADSVVVPVIPEDPGAQGLIHVQQMVDAARSGRNPKLRLAAYALNMVNLRLAVHKAYEKLLREMEPDLVARTTIPMAVPFKEAVMGRVPLPLLKPKVAGSKLLAALALELEERAAAASTAPPRFYYFGNRFTEQGPAIAS